MANQENIIVGSASLKVNGVDVGFTQGGITLRKSNEYVDVDADQLAGVARKVPTFERMFVTTTLLEATRDNMQNVMNEPDSNKSGSHFSFGSGDPVTREFELTVTGDGPDGGTRTYTFYRAISVDDIEHLIGSREAPSVIPVGFELLKDPDNGNRFGTFVDA